MTPEPTSSAVAAAVLSADEVTVQPGGEATLTLTLHNTGTVVEIGRAHV